MQSRKIFDLPRKTVLSFQCAEVSILLIERFLSDEFRIFVICRPHTRLALKSQCVRNDCGWCITFLSCYRYGGLINKLYHVIYHPAVWWSFAKDYLFTFSSLRLLLCLLGTLVGGSDTVRVELSGSKTALDT